MTESKEIQIVTLEDNPELALKIEKVRQAFVELAIARSELSDHTAAVVTAADAGGAYVAARHAAQENRSALDELRDRGLNPDTDPRPRAIWQINRELEGFFYSWMLDTGKHAGYKAGLEPQEAASQADAYRTQVTEQFFGEQESSN